MINLPVDTQTKLWPLIYIIHSQFEYNLTEGSWLNLIHIIHFNYGAYYKLCSVYASNNSKQDKLDHQYRKRGRCGCQTVHHHVKYQQLCSPIKCTGHTHTQRFWLVFFSNFFIKPGRTHEDLDLINKGDPGFVLKHLLVVVVGETRAPGGTYTKQADCT